jgi:hypothetical protein
MWWVRLDLNKQDSKEYSGYSRPPLSLRRYSPMAETLRFELRTLFIGVLRISSALHYRTLPRLRSEFMEAGEGFQPPYAGFSDIHWFSGPAP